MLRRGDSKGQGKQPEGQTAAEPQNQGNTPPSSGTSANPGANIASAGSSWRPMRQTDKEGQPQHEESLIGPQDFFDGTYRSERSIRIQGRVRGSVESRGHILVEEHAQVSADMTAEDITIAGRYNGKVQCRRRFEIASTGIATGEINTDLFVMQEGGYFDGHLKMKQRSGQKTGQSAADTTSPSGSDDQAPAQV